jgi:hypothetical protein
MRFEIVKDEATPTIRLIDARLSDFTPLNERILEIGLSDAAFDVEVSKGALFGRVWAPMAFSTARKGRDPATLMVEHGALLGSLSRGGAGNVFTAGPFEGEAKSEDDSIALHHYGTATEPERSILLWNEERYPEFDAMAADHVTGETADA